MTLANFKKPQAKVFIWIAEFNKKKKLYKVKDDLDENDDLSNADDVIVSRFKSILNLLFWL